MSLIDQSPNSVGPITPGQTGKGSSDVAPEKASNPGRVNRSSITSSEAETHFGGLPQPKLTHKTVPEFTVDVVPSEDVRTHLTKQTDSTKETSAELPDLETELQGEVDRLKQSIDKAGASVDVSSGKKSKQSLERQLTQAKSSVTEAKTFKKEAGKLASQGLEFQGLHDANLGGRAMTPAEQDAVKVLGQATQLVDQREKEVKALKKELNGVVADEKKQAKASKKAVVAEGKLKAGVAALEANVQSLRAKVVTPNGESSKELGKHVHSLKKAVSKAESAVKQGKRLEKRSDAANKAHGVNVKDLKNRASQSLSSAQTELKALKLELSLAKAQKKSLGKREAHEKREQQQVKAHHKAQKKAHAKAKKELAQEEKAERKSLEQQLKSNAAKEKEALENKKTSENKPSVATLTKEFDARKAEHRARKAAVDSVSQQIKAARKTPALRPSSSMKAFLAGVKPARDLSSEGIEKSFSGLSSSDDYKKALVSIGVSKLGLKEKLRLRSGLSSAMLGAIKNEQKFKKLDRSLIEHVMHGDSMGEIQLEFQKAVKKVEAKLDQSARRKT